MPTDNHPSRRMIVISAISAPSAWILGGLSGCSGAAQQDRDLSLSTLADAEAELNRLAAATALRSAAAWTWAQTLEHCAQSIEYSMTGYPRPKSRIFQRTVGSAALGFFTWRGHMTHDLAEPIPGAPVLTATADPAAALARLRASIVSFRAWTKPLAPHFAYGELDKTAYEQAHAMHIANHMASFRSVG